MNRMMPTSVNLESKVQSGELLFNMYDRGNFLVLPTNTGWDVAVTNTGTTFTGPSYLYVNTGLTANSVARAFCAPMGLDSTDYTKLNFDKDLLISFRLARLYSDSQVVSRYQLKTVITEGALGDRGLGIRIDNYSILSESYGTALDTNAIYTLSDKEVVKVSIALYAGSKIEYYINNILKVVHSTVNTIPTGSAGIVWMNSIKNGVTGGVSAFANSSQISMWQDA